MKTYWILLALAALPALAWASDEGPGVSADQAIAQLKDGNDRYYSGGLKQPHRDFARMRETARKGQHPIATILTCSDSRLPVELVFDQGVGDVFVIRVAGNVCGQHEAGTIEYGVDHLKTPVLVVLGHSRCGAVTAVATDAKLHGNIPVLVQGIRPAVAQAQKAHPQKHGADLVPAAIKSNVWQAIDDLFHNSPITRKLAAQGRLKVVGAVYELDTGKVEWMGEHPEKDRLLAYTSQPAEAGHDTVNTGNTTSEHK
jgi:carbonic anhydrase